MIKTLKYFGLSFLIVLLVVSLYLMNLFSSRPYSIDHYLAKELILGVTDSPEYMTYLGIFDDLSFFFKHNQKLSVPSSEESAEDYKDNLERLDIIRGFNDSSLNKNQRITKKIAVFDTENDIESYERFRYHSYPFNQISGNHLNLVEFMTDTHPIRNKNQASDYIKRVKMFDEVLDANLKWLNEQKKLNIYAVSYTHLTLPTKRIV